MVEKVNLANKFGLFSEYCKPKIVGEINDNYVKLTKFQGEFIWHKHEDEDEFFYVVKGKLLIKLRDGDIELEEGDFVIIPHDIEHLPVADEEVHLMLIEPKSTINTGDKTDARTITELEWI